MVIEANGLGGSDVVNGGTVASSTNGHLVQEHNRSDAGPKTGLGDPTDQDIEELVSGAIRKKFHPVILFGGPGSGKTHVIMSILNMLSKPMGIDHALDWSLFPERYPSRAERIASSMAYTEEMLAQYRAGTILKTDFLRPLFIPLRIRAGQPIRGMIDHTKFVFVDGRGENFITAPSNRGNDGSWTQDFQPEIRAFIKSRSPMTMIFVAPYSIGREERTPEYSVSAGLKGVIKKAREGRPQDSKDWNLFLFTKWDLSDRAQRETNMMDPDLSFVESQILGRARDPWGEYYNGEVPTFDRRYFMQFVATTDEVARSGGRDDMNQHPDETVVERYAKTLLNWIYGNATEAACGVRPSLFPETDAFYRTSMPFYDRVLGWLAGARV